jgi:hypothetical protein
MQNDRGEKTIYKCGKTEFDLYANKILVHGSKNTGVKMIHLMNDDEPIEFINTNGIGADIHKNYVSWNNGISIIKKPSFKVFSRDNLNEVMLEDLFKIRFDMLR